MRFHAQMSVTLKTYVNSYILFFNFLLFLCFGRFGGMIGGMLKVCWKVLDGKTLGKREGTTTI